MLLVFITCITFISYAPKVFSKSHTRIVDGTDSSIIDFPFMVSLRRYPSGEHFCGGTILNENWILTAAHCIKSKKAEDVTIQYGLTNIRERGKNVVNVKKLIAHDEFNKCETFGCNDIGLIELEEPIKIGQRAQPVTLPNVDEEVEDGTDAVFVGWGLNANENDHGVIQKHLKSVHLPIVNLERCEKVRNLELQQTNLCAGYIKMVKGTCDGDSGGPLLVNNKQVGIMSFGTKTCARRPSVFTKVSKYINWINDHQSNA